MAIAPFAVQASNFVPLHEMAVAIPAQVRKVIYVYFRVLEKRSANTSTEDPTDLRRVLKHLGLWLANARPIPRAHSPPDEFVPFEDSFSQLPALEEEDFSQLPPARWEC